MDRRRLWNERYARGETADKPPEPIVVSTAARLPPACALDLACGLGRNSLYLAALGWRVKAVDYSATALQMLRERMQSADLDIQLVHADLERGEYEIPPSSTDLILDCCYLQRDLFPIIRAGVRPGGYFVGVLPLAGDPSMNPRYLVEPGELRGYFDDWEIEQYSEGRPGNDPARRMRAQIAARRPASGPPRQA